jgi:hypothetical protein
MSIYTVREVTGNAKAHPHLESRGLKAKSVTISSLDPLAIPEYPQIAYHLYSKLLPAFMVSGLNVIRRYSNFWQLATQKREVLPTTRPGYNLIERYRNCVPILFPPLTVRFERKLSAEEMEAMKGRGAGVMAADKDDPMYTFGGTSVTEDLLTHLYKHPKKAKTTNSCNAGTINLSQYQSLFKGMAIITWFLKTQSYPAFSRPINDDEDAGSAFETLEGLISSKRKGVFGDNHLAKRQKVPGAEGDVEMEADDEDELLFEYEIGDSAGRIPKAKPSNSPEVIYGPVASVPTLPGLSFPYFPDMLEADTNFVANIVRTHFLECLGDTREAILGGYRQFKGAHGAIAQTQTGRILQHMFLGVKLAIEGQARLFLIIDNDRYLGFTLHGWYFTLSIDGYKHSPYAHEELLSQVRVIDEHSVALAQILTRLMKLKLPKTGKVMAKRAMQERKETVSKNPRALAGLIREYQIVDADEIEEIEKLATKLSFPQRFWTFDPEKILSAIDYLLSGEFPPDSEPMYARGGTLTTSNSAMSTLALFGDQGFSFRTTGGAALAIPTDKDADTLFKAYRGKNNKDVTPNPTLIISKKSLNLCVEDWEAFLIDKKFLNKTSRDQAFRSVALGGTKGRALWFGLIERIGPLVHSSGGAVHADTMDLGSEQISAVEDSFLDFL